MFSRRFILVVPAVFSLIACTLLPTPTPVTLVETVEVEVTRPVTQRVVITARPSSTPPATPEPRSLFADDFEAGEGEWSVETIPQGAVSVVDGELTIEVSEANFLLRASHPALDLLDTYSMEVDISYVSGPTIAEAGIGLRCGSDQVLDLGIAADGTFSIFRAISVGATGLDFDDIIPYVQTSAINRGQALNRVRIVDDNKEVIVHVNAELVAKFPFDEIPPGCPGLYVRTFKEGGAVWSFDNLSIRELER